MSYSFVDFIEKHNIEVPKLQREFAFGRNDKISEEKRNRFISKIFESFDLSETLYLNFVYGTTKDKLFIPLDGQQRLTILFLLHWYVLLKENKLELLRQEDGNSKFQYDTRYSSTVFLNHLVNFKSADTELGIVEQIKDMNWFELSWRHDANIMGCLTLLHSIEKEALENRNFTLENLSKITFDVIDIDAYKMSDDIYIKINSRGKQLTTFENFKAAFLENAKNIDEELHDEIANKFDNEWNKLFWEYIDFEEKNTSVASQLDSKYFNYAKYVAQITCWEKGNGDIIEEDFLLISSIKSIFENRDDLINFKTWFDIFYEIPNLDQWFDNKFYKTEEAFPEDVNKIRLWQEPNLLKELVERKTSRQRELLFYSLGIYLMHKSEISETDFMLRFRSLRNVLEAGDKKSYNNMLRDRDMVNAIEQVYHFILYGKLLEDTTWRMRKAQFEYEIEKNKFILENNIDFTPLFRLEDADYSHGITQHLEYKDNEILEKYIELLKLGSLELTKILLSYDYQFKTRDGEATYFPTNQSDRSSFYRGATEKDGKLIEILKKHSIEEMKNNPEIYIEESIKNNKYTSSYYAIKYPLYFIMNNKEAYKYANIKKFNDIGECLTNKSSIQWHNYQNTILLTIKHLMKDSRIELEWLDGENRLFINDSYEMNSTSQGFIVKSDVSQAQPFEARKQNANYDFLDRVQYAKEIIEKFSAS